MKALKILKSIGMNIHKGKTIEAVQLPELSWGRGTGKTRSTYSIMLLSIRAPKKHSLTKYKPDYGLCIQKRAAMDNAV